MTLNITDLVALEVGKEIPLKPGNILVVDVRFNYIVSEPVDVTLWASLGIGMGRDVESFLPIYLDEALTPKTWEGSTEIAIPTSGIANGTYWMKVEVNGTEITIPNAVIISGVLDIWEMIGPLLVLGLMAGIVAMMAPALKEGV